MSVLGMSTHIESPVEGSQCSAGVTTRVVRAWGVC